MLTTVHSFSQSNSKSKIVTTKSALESAFNSVLQKMETNETICWSVNAIIGDINSDGINDGLIKYACGLKDGGNAIAGSGLAIFININGVLVHKGNFEEIVSFVPKRISSGLIHGEILEYGPDDARCCPSIITPTSLKFENNKLEKVTPNTSKGKTSNPTINTETNELNSAKNNNCPENLSEININNIIGTARKYKAVDGHYYYEVKLNVKPSLTTMKYTTKIQVNKKSSPYVMYSIKSSSGVITIKGCTENDVFEVEGIYSCNTGRFKGPSATIYFRDLKLIQ